MDENGKVGRLVEEFVDELQRTNLLPHSETMIVCIPQQEERDGGVPRPMRKAQASLVRRDQEHKNGINRALKGKIANNSNNSNSLLPGGAPAAVQPKSKAKRKANNNAAQQPSLLAPPPPYETVGLPPKYDLDDDIDTLNKLSKKKKGAQAKRKATSEPEESKKSAILAVGSVEGEESDEEDGGFGAMVRERQKRVSMRATFESMMMLNSQPPPPPPQKKTQQKTSPKAKSSRAKKTPETSEEPDVTTKKKKNEKNDSESKALPLADSEKKSRSSKEKTSTAAAKTKSSSPPAQRKGQVSKRLSEFSEIEASGDSSDDSGSNEGGFIHRASARSAAKRMEKLRTALEKKRKLTTSSTKEKSKKGANRKKGRGEETELEGIDKLFDFNSDSEDDDWQGSSESDDSSELDVQKEEEEVVVVAKEKKNVAVKRGVKNVDVSQEEAMTPYPIVDHRKRFRALQEEEEEEKEKTKKIEPVAKKSPIAKKRKNTTVQEDPPVERVEHSPKKKTVVSSPSKRRESNVSEEIDQEDEQLRLFVNNHLTGIYKLQDLPNRSGMVIDLETLYFKKIRDPKGGVSGHSMAVTSREDDAFGCCCFLPPGVSVTSEATETHETFIECMLCPGAKNGHFTLTIIRNGKSLHAKKMKEGDIVHLKAGDKCEFGNSSTSKPSLCHMWLLPN
eukprot:GDKK01064781.1.p1 GENE.GDKK01064781.1~~GDKK01064781.1.p1  ORF type:complete len:675 (+),score=204.21 GDKK01064781.1:1-2025(+)